MCHPTARNFNRMTVVSFQAAPVGYEFMLYGYSYRKILPGVWAIVNRDEIPGEYTIGWTATDRQMADMAQEYREREED